MNTSTPIIDNDWLDFLDTGESKDFLSRVWQTSEEYEALLLDILPKKSQHDLDLEREEFLQLQKDTKQESRRKEVLEFAEWHIYGWYEQIFLYRDWSNRDWVQGCWKRIWEALSRLSDEEQERAIEYCRGMCLTLEKDYPGTTYYKWAHDFFGSFDFRSGIPSIPSRYFPDEPLMRKDWLIKFDEWSDLLNE